MLTSSMRRAVCTAACSQSALQLSTISTRVAIPSSKALSYSSHQRRCSSSKPSSPADGSKGIADGQAVPATSAQGRANGEKKPTSSRTTRRKAKDVAAACTVKGRDDSLYNLPSVPSTQHLKTKDIAASAFFSLHRPLSVTTSFPRTVTSDSFAAIFTPRVRSNKTSTSATDVISTLSQTVNRLEIATSTERWNPETDELRAAITAESYRNAEARHLDEQTNGSAGEGVLNLLIPVSSGRYMPFNPPAPPVPMDVNSEQSLKAGAEAAGLDSTDVENQAHTRTYKAVLMIEESTDANGEVTLVAHSPHVVEDPTVPASFLDRMNIRQEKYEEYRNRRAEDTGIWAISVKRQRRLKMKKHKHKKLMRRTRTLRRKLERS